MPDLKCKCSTPYGQGWVIVTCKEESCLKCCPRTLLEDVTQSSKPTTEVANIVKIMLAIMIIFILLVQLQDYKENTCS